MVCPKCSCDKLKEVRPGAWKCSNCGHTWFPVEDELETVDFKYDDLDEEALKNYLGDNGDDDEAPD